MARIEVLPETLANQIAAGEVIERPAAVVKELCENALDAQAHRVEVDLGDGGCTLVRVRDDGSGMSPGDAQRSLERHATSKLRSKDDLFRITTYGFRGEALPSIAAVSRFTLLSCEHGALSGTRIEIEGGRVVSLAEAGAPPGTTVEARDLFFNVPARKKFLKRVATEQAHGIEAVLRLAVPRSDVDFTVRESGRVLLRLQRGEGAAVREERAAQALGSEVAGRLLPFEATVRGIRAHGLAASPSVEHSSVRAVWLFVNGRAVRDRQLGHAVLRAYGEVMPHGRFPAALVFVEVPPSEVDVNVHPAKAEVRLADPRAAYEAIAAGLRSVLAPGVFVALESQAASRPTGTYASVERTGLRAAESAGPPLAVASAIAPELLQPSRYFASLRYLGQLHRTYLVCEGRAGLVLIDQHAAHERMNYQRLRRAAHDRGPRAQPLLVPHLVQLSPATASSLGGSIPALETIGIEVEPFGNGTAAIKALPALLSHLPAAKLSGLLADVVEELALHGKGESAAQIEDALLARAACHASVRAHDDLADGEARALLAALDDTDYGARCAHGRPVVAEVGVPEIEKRFGRDYDVRRGLLE
ncbi:MAG: DNA mismatch repair endonuclease MutL [Deltaproteobacteria bacterium]|nr:MAG: DNA mismatch repair endonuclease MutL [Deltaproteobacteria bacterium]